MHYHDDSILTLFWRQVAIPEMVVGDSALLARTLAELMNGPTPWVLDILPYGSYVATSLLLLMATPEAKVSKQIRQMRQKRLFAQVGAFLAGGGQERLTKRWWATRGVTPETVSDDLVSPIDEEVAGWSVERSDDILSANNRLLPLGFRRSPVALVRVEDMRDTAGERGKGE